MPDPTLFYLIRHAEPEMGSNGRICLGRKLDVPLSEYGKKQALLLGEQLKEKHFDFIFTSPLLRARQTADALTQDCPRIIAPELTEVDGGEWDGMLFSEIHTRYSSFFDNSEEGAGQTPPGGESDEKVLERGLAFLEKLTQDEGKRYALVTHSGFGRILLCHLMGKPLFLKRTIPMKYASCTMISCCNSSWNVGITEGLLL